MGRVDNYQYYKSRGRCVHCHKVDAFTMNGRSYCADCTEKNREYGKKSRALHADKTREHDIKERVNRKAAGLCIRCGRPKSPPDMRYASCAKCRAYDARKHRETAPKAIPRYLRPSLGLCSKCCAPVKEGLSLGDKPYRLCDRCYEDAVSGLRTASATLREMHVGGMVFLDQSMVTKSRGAVLSGQDYQL